MGILGSGLAAYLLARQHLKRPAALVAAVAYAYAPYQAYDVLFRGNLAESAAWPLLPWAVWLNGAAGANELPDLTAQLALVDADGLDRAEWGLAPAGLDWPTSGWRAGELWRGQHLLRLPAGLESGDYGWMLSLADTPVAAELGPLQIDAPDRLWQAPPLDYSIKAALARQVTLLGYNLQPSLSARPGETVTVTLAWQGQAEMAISYRVFLHLLDSNGDLAAQSDGEPADWNRPTTGWAPGEVVLDRRTLTIPADIVTGEYTLVTGLYDAVNGERLALPDGSTSITLGPMQVNTP